jgi:hypothetical protein
MRFFLGQLLCIFLEHLRHIDYEPLPVKKIYCQKTPSIEKKCTAKISQAFIAAKPVEFSCSKKYPQAA